VRGVEVKVEVEGEDRRVINLRRAVGWELGVLQ
jgi:hypothetical protein